MSGGITLGLIKKPEPVIPFPLWAFLQLVYTLNPKDNIPHDSGIKALAAWIGPIESPDSLPSESYPPYLTLRYDQEIIQILGPSYDRFKQYYAIKNFCNPNTFFR